MNIKNIELVIGYFEKICTSLPIGGFGIKVLHDAMLEVAELKLISPCSANNGMELTLPPKQFTCSNHCQGRFCLLKAQDVKCGENPCAITFNHTPVRFP
jgi:hypothetical protein